MINLQDRQRIEQAIQAAEQTTRAEIVCVLARQSSSYAYAPLLWAAFIALTVPWILALATDWPTLPILAFQIILFIALALLASWPPLQLALTPRAVKRTRAYRAAIEQFFARGVSRTKNHSGVLIFVSLAERYARIVADDGVAEKVDHAQWKAAVDTLTKEISHGNIAEGYIKAIALCAAILAEHAPPDGTGGLLPDRIFIMN